MNYISKYYSLIYKLSIYFRSEKKHKQNQIQLQKQSSQALLGRIFLMIRFNLHLILMKNIQQKETKQPYLYNRWILDLVLLLISSQNLEQDNTMNPRDKRKKTRVELTQANIIAKKYKVIQQLGKGASSIVVQAQNIKNGQIVAIKIIRTFLQNIHQSIRVLRQVILLRKLKHPNIINLKDVILEQKDGAYCLYLVLQYFQKDIKRIFCSTKEFSFDQIKRVIFQILAGLKHCHQCKVLHRDLKPQNILAVQKNGKIETVKLCDFGLARTVIIQQLNNQYVKIRAQMKALEGKQGKQKQKQYNLSMHVVTRWYRAPQLILLEKNYNMAIDMWSVGCILGQLLSMMKENGNSHNERRPLFPGRACYPLSPPKSAEMNYKKVNDFPHSVYDQLSMIFTILGTPQDISFISDQRAKNYIKSFGIIKKKPFNLLFNYLPPQSSLKFNPSERLSVSQAIAHPLFDDIRSLFEVNVNVKGQSINFDLSGLKKQQLLELVLQQQSFYRDNLNSPNMSMKEQKVVNFSKQAFKKKQQNPSGMDIQKQQGIEMVQE